MAQPVEVSVVIPCHNDARFLAAQLQSLADQEVALGWEVIVVDADSDDGSALVARGFSELLPIRVVTLPKKVAPGVARNRGVQVAQGNKLLFLDADDVTCGGYVAEMAKALDSMAMVSSRLDVETLNPGWLRGAHGEPWQQHGVASWHGFLPSAGTCNLAVTKAVFHEVGGFPEEYRVTEDVAFTWLAQLKGVGLGFVPSACLLYRFRDSLRLLFWQTFTWGAASPFLYKQFRDQGMPRRSWRAAGREWSETLVELGRVRSRAAAAKALVRLGYAMGRTWGCLRHRVGYP